MAKLQQIPAEEGSPFLFVAVDIKKFRLIIEDDGTVELYRYDTRKKGYRWYFDTLDEAYAFVYAYFGHLYEPLPKVHPSTRNADTRRLVTE